MDSGLPVKKEKLWWILIYEFSKEDEEQESENTVMGRQKVCLCKRSSEYKYFPKQNRSKECAQTTVQLESVEKLWLQKELLPKGQAGTFWICQGKLRCSIVRICWWYSSSTGCEINAFY